MSNEVVLASDATAPIRILYTWRDLHTDTGEATYLLLVSFAQPSRVFVRSENLIASLKRGMHI